MDRRPHPANDHDQRCHRQANYSKHIDLLDRPPVYPPPPPATVNAFRVAIADGFGGRPEGVHAATVIGAARSLTRSINAPTAVSFCSIFS